MFELFFFGGGIGEGKKKASSESRKCAPKKILKYLTTKSNLRQKKSLPKK